MSGTMINTHTESVRIGRAEISLETGKIARQAGGAVVVCHGASFVLGTVVGARRPSPGLDFFPLTVEYREKMAGGGRIPGGFFRREGRISEREILTSRLIDRSIRPLFPKGFRSETQVLVTVFSADANSDLESLGILAATAAVHLSDLPFEGPVAGLRWVRRGKRFLPMPEQADRDGADIDFVISASRNGLVMLEGAAKRISNIDMLEALDAASETLEPVLDAIDRLRTKAGRPKRSMPSGSDGLLDQVRRCAENHIVEALAIDRKEDRQAALRDAQEAALAALGNDHLDPPGPLADAYGQVVRGLAREQILAGGRIDGRGRRDVRPIFCEVGLLERAHGSALFTRGETQALVTTTLGTLREAQDTESVFGMKRERFLLHYNFPPYSVGEARPARGPGRREIGHGNLARRALAAVIPSADRYAYTVRVESDITESNGSSSMATVCGGCLALMDAGVPIEAPVAGIAMGLVCDGERVAILSDILGDEDHLGDMDFKIAGTDDGITALQLDNKLGSLPRDVLAAALEQAQEGRRHILDAMRQTLAAPRDQVAPHAPQFARLQVNPTRIRALIGKGGRTIQEIQASTKTRIEVNSDTGDVAIYGQDQAGTRLARRRVRDLTLELRRDGLYLARVVGLRAHGAIVRISDHEGLVHISELAAQRIESVAAAVHEGEEILIRVLGADERGRLRLSRKAALGESALDALNA